MPAARPGLAAPFTVTDATRQPTAGSHEKEQGSPHRIWVRAAGLPTAPFTATAPPSAGEAAMAAASTMGSKATDTRWSPASPSKATNPAFAAPSSAFPSTVTEATRQPVAGAKLTRAVFLQSSWKDGVQVPSPEKSVAMANCRGAKSTWRRYTCPSTRFSTMKDPASPAASSSAESERASPTAAPSASNSARVAPRTS